MKRPAGNLLDWWKNRRKPKPQMMEMTMSDYNELISLIDDLVRSYLDTKAKIGALESTNLILNRQIADMDAEMKSDAATKAAAIDKIKGVLNPDVGGSMGGIVG